MFDPAPMKPIYTSGFKSSARPTLLYVVAAILVVHYVVGTLGEALFGWRYTHLTAYELTVIIAPVIYYFFQRTYEKKQGLSE